MDGGEREKAMLQKFNMQCKIAYRQRRSSKPNDKASSARPLLSASPAIQPERSPWSDAFTSIREEIAAESPMSSPADLYQHRSALSDAFPRSTSIQSPYSTVDNRFSYSEHEIDLVMYYLDHIFPRLNPFFEYTPTNKGRGWLLNLFLRTKPLCALAVVLSECDRAQLVLGALNETPQPHLDLELQHIQIVTDLRDHLTRLSDSDGAYQMAAAVEALACIMHLILFELWIPRKGEFENDWVLHLDAASILLESVARRPGQTPPIDVCTAADEDIARHFPIEYLSSGEQSAFQFYLTQYAYSYCITVASLGLNPARQLLFHRIRDLFSESSNKLRNMLGCDDGIMIAMLDIAALRDWKEQMQETSNLSLRELGRRADRIETILNDKMSLLTSVEPSAQSRFYKEQVMITRCFASASLVYLHVVTSGFWPNLPEIKQSVIDTIEALEDMRGRTEINISSWAYCVAGCLAREPEYPRIRALNPAPKPGTHPLVLTKWTLDIIEEAWRVRANLMNGVETCDWVVAMQRLNTRLLLA